MTKSILHLGLAAALLTSLASPVLAALALVRIQADDKGVELAAVVAAFVERTT